MTGTHNQNLDRIGTSSSLGAVPAGSLMSLARGFILVTAQANVNDQVDGDEPTGVRARPVAFVRSRRGSRRQNPDRSAKALAERMNACPDRVSG